MELNKPEQPFFYL